MPINIRTVCLAIVTFAASATAQAAVVYREADDGEISADGLSPTAITLGVGSNEIFGRVGGGGGGAPIAIISSSPFPSHSSSQPARDRRFAGIHAKDADVAPVGS